MSKRGRGGSSGGKFRISLGLPVAAVMNCADNTGESGTFSENAFRTKYCLQKWFSVPVSVSLCYSKIEERDSLTPFSLNEWSLIVDPITISRAYFL